MNKPTLAQLKAKLANYYQHIAALEAQIQELQPPTPAPIASEAWPPPAHVCSCETFGGNSDDWNCPTCGGGRF